MLVQRRAISVQTAQLLSTIRSSTVGLSAM